MVHPFKLEAFDGRTRAKPVADHVNKQSRLNGDVLEVGKSQTVCTGTLELWYNGSDLWKSHAQLPAYCNLNGSFCKSQYQPSLLRSSL
jgi:hypothetical protein